MIGVSIPLRPETLGLFVFLKGRIEKIVLGEVSKSINIALKPGQAFISVKLYMKRIESLQLDIFAYSLAESILVTPKMKLKQQHLRVLDHEKLVIFPPEADRMKLYFAIHILRNMLPKVIVKGISTVEHGLFNQDKGKCNLLVEGTNLVAEKQIRLFF